MLTSGRQKIKQTLTFFSVEREALAIEVMWYMMLKQSSQSAHSSKAEQSKQGKHT
jgi:hypothetical protein